jgi:hypothetical protein
MSRIITRQEIYEAVWLIPPSELTKQLNTSVAGLNSVCEQMKIPCPDPNYWILALQGMQPDPPPLPAATPGMPTAASIVRPEPAVEVAPVRHRVSMDEQIKSSSKIQVPLTLENAHRFVKQTRRALTTNTYLRKGFVEMAIVAAAAGNAPALPVSETGVQTSTLSGKSGSPCW